MKAALPDCQGRALPVVRLVVPHGGEAEVALADRFSVEHRGGLDRFLAQARQAQLSDGAAALKREIAKKQAETEAKAA